MGSEGIWQIFGQAHPSVSLGCAQDPNCASDAARQISNNWTNWSPWSTFNSGAYKQFLQGGVSPDTSTSLLSVPNPQNLVDDAARNIRSVFEFLTGKTPEVDPGAAFGDIGVRVGLFALGALLVGIGVLILFRPTSEAAVGTVTGGRFQRMAR